MAVFKLAHYLEVIVQRQSHLFVVRIGEIQRQVLRHSNLAGAEEEALVVCGDLNQDGLVHHTFSERRPCFGIETHNFVAHQHPYRLFYVKY